MVVRREPKPDIALVLPALLGGGVERVFLSLARGFAARGLRVDLVVAKNEGPLAQQLPDGVHLVDLGVPRRGRLLRVYPHLLKYFRLRSPLWTIPVWGYFDLVPLEAARRAGVRTLWILHNAPDYLDDLPFQKRILALWAMKMALVVALRLESRGMARLGAVSKGILSAFSERFGLPLEAKEVYPNPLAVERVWELAEEPVPHPFGDEGLCFFLSVGRLHPQKGFPLLLNAFARFRQKGYENYRLLILGEGPERPRLEAMVQKLGLEGSVALPGFVPNPYPFFKRSQGFIMTSEYEGFPLVLLEALALGTPVVAALARGGVAETLQHGRFGLLVPRSPEALAQAMEHLVKGSYTPPSREEVMAYLEKHRLENVVDFYLFQMGFGGNRG